MFQQAGQQGQSPAKAKDDPLAIPQGLNKRCDLPPEAYFMPDRQNDPFARRPGFGKAGEKKVVGVNQFRVMSYPTRDVFQYDVSLKPEPQAAIVYKKVWETATVQGKLKELKAPWLYDNRKLAWSSKDVSGIQCSVDLGASEGRRPGKDVYTFEMKQTGTIRMEALKAYLEGKMDWDNSVLEAISFLDHVLRQGPSTRMQLLKRTFFNEKSETQALNAYSEAIKGIYAAIRLNNSLYSGGIGLGVNVDVSNQAFWIGQNFAQLVRNFLSCMDRRWENLTYENMRQVLKPVPVKTSDGRQTWAMSEAFKALRRLHNLRFKVEYRGDTPKEYKVKRFAFGPEHGADGANAKNVTFSKKLEDGSTKETSVFDYFLQQYRIRVQHWYFPLIETTKAGYFPMEVCNVDRFNSYAFKLDPAQTQAMIKFAVQRPPARKQQVMNMVRNLEWDKDRYLAHFGIKINTNMPMVEARLLPNPAVQYANRTVDPKLTGRWDLRGVKFVMPNAQPLKSWGFFVLDNCVDKPTIENFAKQFRNIYAGHGGKIANDPFVAVFPPRGEPFQIVSRAYKMCLDANKEVPQIIFFVLRDRTASTYEGLKKNADCRPAVVTQMLQSMHVRKAQPQYCSNVCMKVNAKLGGQTSKIAGPGPAGTSVFFKVPTMMIGVDVSHGHAAGGPRPPSFAAMCVSMDKDAAIYNAAVQTNGWGVEILQPTNMFSMLGPLIIKWVKRNNTKPQHVFYVRDGVSEGQFAHVMQWEYEEMRKVFKAAIDHVPKITVIIATKRHHIRFFPQDGDRNGNCYPGTVVEREVTHPFQYDFYLCSHAAIQGTARPVHYNVIHDECKLAVDDLQRILYQQCYQYCRSTTPVSLHPAVYYAHLAGARARHHEEENMTPMPIPSDSKHVYLQRLPQGAMAKHDSSKKDPSESQEDTQPPPLKKIGSEASRPDVVGTFKNAMWWV
ncbi:hypothetical protein VTK56DRAFT_1445 [Thermocarpiscus australiensis]